MSTDDTPAARIVRLRATRDRLEAQLKDPKTPAYSVAPLSNQLRLTDKELDRIQHRESEKDDGLPVTPEEATLLDFMQYGSRHRVRVRSRSTSPNAWCVRQMEIWAEWEAAGFEPPTRPPDDPDVPRRVQMDEWTEACRAELIRCLAATVPTEGADDEQA